MKQVKREAAQDNAILWVSPSLLVIDELNDLLFPLTANDLEMLTRSIEQIGFQDTKIIDTVPDTKRDGHYLVLDGRKRTKAAQLLAIEKVPIRVLTKLTDEQKFEAATVNNVLLNSIHAKLPPSQRVVLAILLLERERSSGKSNRLFPAKIWSVANVSKSDWCDAKRCVDRWLAEASKQNPKLNTHDLLVAILKKEIECPGLFNFYHSSKSIRKQLQSLEGAPSSVSHDAVEVSPLTALRKYVTHLGKNSTLTNSEQVIVGQVLQRISDGLLLGSGHQDLLRSTCIDVAELLEVKHHRAE
ncbi:ParB/RepB/Spo0J family partition protein [Nitrospira sp. Nam74]